MKGVDMIYVIADIHGSAAALGDLCYKIKSEHTITENDYLIIAGDAGIVYGSYVMGNLRKNLSKLPCTVIIMRGNHDARYWEVAQNNPDKWEFVVSENGDKYAREKKYPRILYVSDIGGVYEIGGKQILFCPGGYSVDKFYRLQMGYPYEPSEEMTQDEFDALLKTSGEKPYSYIISHVAPYKINDRLSHLFLDCVDQSTVSSFSEKNLDAIYDRHDWKMWYFGHYHGDLCFDDVNMCMVYNDYGVIG